MNKRVALSAYGVLWVLISGAVITSIYSSGYPLFLAIICAYLLFLFLNGSLAYIAMARRIRLEGKDPPGYWTYLLFPTGVPRFREAAPRSMHIFVGAIASIVGAFLLYCGVALAIDAEWSLIQHPGLAVLICLIPTCLGGMLLFFAWRALKSSKTSA
jgi:hypothetical protein